MWFLFHPLHAFLPISEKLSNHKLKIQPNPRNQNRKIRPLKPRLQPKSPHPRLSTPLPIVPRLPSWFPNEKPSISPKQISISNYNGMSLPKLPKFILIPFTKPKYGGNPMSIGNTKTNIMPYKIVVITEVRLFPEAFSMQPPIVCNVHITEWNSMAMEYCEISPDRISPFFPSRLESGQIPYFGKRWLDLFEYPSILNIRDPRQRRRRQP